MKKKIRLSQAELQSGSSRVDWAEGLIEQLPEDHDGRNSWLMNYGKKAKAQAIRDNDNKARKDNGFTERDLVWNKKTECLCSAT